MLFTENENYILKIYAMHEQLYHLFHPPVSFSIQYLMCHT